MYDNGITIRSDVPIQFYVFNLVCLCSVIVSFFPRTVHFSYQVRVRQVEALVKRMQGTTRFE
jgi:hypothetical protein